MWQEKLKAAGVNIHLVATGGGAGFQNELWSQPGSSAYLSGASFPYSPEEQEEFLGFMPEHFCSEENAIDLACAAYMKAYKFGGKNPVGVSITASVASEKEHRGDHRLYTCIVTNDKILTTHQVLEKGVGRAARLSDGNSCDDALFFTVLDGLGISEMDRLHQRLADATDLAKERFFARPFFTAEGKRLPTLPSAPIYALMPGAFNPPHEGHFGAANNVLRDYGLETVFEVTAIPPHKEALSVQQLLQRSKLLQGHNRVFTRKEPYYLDKARAFPGVPLVMGADAMVRMLDPKWGLDAEKMFDEFSKLGTKLYIGGRDVNGKFTTRHDIMMTMPLKLATKFHAISEHLDGEWHVSSTELRKKLL